MKLWLDDERNPQNFQAADFHWVKTAEEAIALLRAGEVTEISFDHDLGTDLDGHDVAQEIESLVYFQKINLPQWKIHSANPVGREEIKRAMESAERFQAKNSSREN